MRKGGVYTTLPPLEDYEKGATAEPVIPLPTTA